MQELLFVMVIVAVVMFMSGRSFYRTMTGKNDGCGCSGNCHRCAYKGFGKKDQGQETDK